MAKILVVDDDEGILDAFKAMLEFTGYDVLTSPEAETLFKLSKQDLPDLILLDVLLSGADGRDLCKFLKAQKQTKRIPIILVSAHPNADSNLKEIGADDFLAKPFEMQDMLDKINKHLKRASKKTTAHSG